LFPSRQGRGLRGLSASLKAMSSDTSKVFLTPRLARRLAAVVSANLTPGGSRSPSQSPSKEPLSGEGRVEDKKEDKEGLQASSEQSPPPSTPPTRSPSISASSSSSSSSSPALEPAGELRREPMNVYNLNAIIREQVQRWRSRSSSLLSFRPLVSSPPLPSPPLGEVPPAGSGHVSAAVSTKSCSQGTGPSAGQGQRELLGGDPEAQISAQHQEGADRHPQTGAQGEQTGETHDADVWRVDSMILTWIITFWTVKHVVKMFWLWLLVRHSDSLYQNCHKYVSSPWPHVKSNNAGIKESATEYGWSIEKHKPVNAVQQYCNNIHPVYFVQPTITNDKCASEGFTICSHTTSLTFDLTSDQEQLPRNRKKVKKPTGEQQRRIPLQDRQKQ